MLASVCYEQKQTGYNKEGKEKALLAYIACFFRGPIQLNGLIDVINVQCSCRRNCDREKNEARRQLPS